MNRHRAVVLLSGGLDSAFNLWQAKRDHDVVLSLTFDYGQRAAAAEVRSAAKLSQLCGVTHQVVQLPWFKDFTSSSLVNRQAVVPLAHDIEIDSLEVSNQTAKAVWVPNRNGIFLNIAAGYAEGLGADLILTGFNIEEAATFPDNTQAYLDATNFALEFSTANKVRAFSYCANMSKTEIVRAGKKIGLPLKELWPCYLDGEEWCGVCESCQRFARAVRAKDEVGISENTLD